MEVLVSGASVETFCLTLLTLHVLSSVPVDCHVTSMLVVDRSRFPEDFRSRRGNSLLVLREEISVENRGVCFPPSGRIKSSLD